MAKKKKPAAPKKGKPAKKPTNTRKAKPAARPEAQRKRTLPRSVPLPGMEQVRNRKLDVLCESIGDTRAQMNQLRADEAGDERAALAEMRKAGLTSYRHANVELARVPGEEKLRVRTSKETATAETADVDDAGNPEPADLGEGDPGLTVDEADLDGSSGDPIH